MRGLTTGNLEELEEGLGDVIWPLLEDLQTTLLYSLMLLLTAITIRNLKRVD